MAFLDEDDLPPQHAQKDKPKPTAVLSLSGGLDSAVLLYWLKDQGYNVIAFNFYYGSKHNPFEKLCATQLADLNKAEFYTVDVGQSLRCNKSALTNPGVEVPEGHYEAESMRQTVVPGRNTVFAAHLLAVAEGMGCQKVAMGVHAGDHFIYPDCRPDWVGAMQRVYEVASEGKVGFLAPFTHSTKVDIVRFGILLKVPFEMSRTCYAPQYKACGRCGSCQERLSAFAANGIPDPIEYDTRELIKK